MPFRPNLIEIRRRDFPCPRGEMDVVRVMHFCQMIERPRLLRIGESISPAVVRDGNVPLFDVNIGSSIFTHGPQFHQVTVWIEFLSMARSERPLG